MAADEKLRKSSEKEERKLVESHRVRHEFRNAALNIVIDRFWTLFLVVSLSELSAW